MKCLLMNKNKKIALIELNTDYNNIEKIYEIYNIDYAPLSFKNACLNKAENKIKILNNWYRGRGIPDWRKDIKLLLDNLHIKSSDELLNQSYALSLSDQYWIKEENQKIEWENINFFTNDFKYKGYLNASLNLSDKNEKIDLYSPNNTTDGMLQKAWIIENNKRLLVKSSYYPPKQEPLNEWLASQISQKLGLNYCDYKIDIINNNIVSKCEDFINENQEIITAYDILNSEKKDNNTNDLNHYINILNKNGINDARKKVQDMFLVDYIIMNFDRHLRNFGIIRNVENLKWENTTPIFDSGESMESNKIFKEINFNDGICKFFNNTNKKFSQLLDYIDLSQYDFNKIKDVPLLFKNKLKEYQPYTDISDERIEKIYIGLKNRIDNLIYYQKNTHIKHTGTEEKELLKDPFTKNKNYFEEDEEDEPNI